MGKLGNAIIVEGLSFGYTKKLILDNVTFSIPAGSFTVIMGQNGSGKSTLLRLISGLIQANSGNISVFENSLVQLSLKQKARLIGFLGQHHKSVFPFRVEDVVLTGRASYAGLAPKKADWDIAFESLDKAGISELKERFYTDLSGGEQQLVMIARILAQQPKILLLDEPVSHLDYNNQLRIIKLIRQFVNEGITVVATLHDPNTAFLFSDYFLFVHNKKVLADSSGKPWNNHILKEIYNEEMETVSYKGKNIVLPKNL